MDAEKQWNGCILKESFEDMDDTKPVRLQKVVGRTLFKSRDGFGIGAIHLFV
jgi:hypothetical protein